MQKIPLVFIPQDLFSLLGFNGIISFPQARALPHFTGRLSNNLTTLSIPTHLRVALKAIQARALNLAVGLDFC